MPPRAAHHQNISKCAECAIVAKNILFRCFKVNAILFIFKSLLFAVIKLRNFKTLLYRFFTIGLVAAHYFFVEKIQFEQRVPNERSLLTFVIGWHFAFMLFKIAEETRKIKHDDLFHVIIGMTAPLGVITILVFLITPFMAWFNAEYTQIECSYYSWRYLIMALYIVFNILISVFPLVNNFMFFLSDGIILSQITTLYMFNEFSMTCLLSILPVLFVLQNHGIIKGIKNFTKDETNGKLSFTRLIGRHDAVFLFVIYTLFVFLFNAVDFISTNYFYATNFWYMIYALYTFGKLMENKKIGYLKYFSFISVLLYTAIFLYSMNYQPLPFPNRTFPLYQPPALANLTNSLNLTQSNSTVEDANSTDPSAIPGHAL